MILVVGGAGYIGSQVVKQLNEAGFVTITYDNLKKGQREAVIASKFILGDIRDTSRLSKLFKENQVEAVMHFAADSLVGESMENPLAYFENNVAGTINLLKTMINFGVKRFIFSSTAAVYGEPQQIPIMETDPTVPTNPYGESKLMIERILARCDEAYGLKYISLRYFNAAGADESGQIGEAHHPETHLIPLILQVALGQREAIKVFGTDYPTPDGTCIRDYIHVVDLAEAHILALKALIAGKTSTVYNLGNGNGHSVKEVIEAAGRITGRKIPVIEARRRRGDPAVLVTGSTKAIQELGWKPRLADLETIIATAWQWHRNPSW
ncbi:MAG: UDP-glucose 4-epimerase GalE [bacterium]|nr:UDP-glucose 4-epimerase GalE [bacterium]